MNTTTVKMTSRKNYCPGEGFIRALAEGDQCSRLHPAELHTIRGRRFVPCTSHRADNEALESFERTVRGGAQERGARRLADSKFHHCPRSGYIDRENEVIVGLQTEAPLKRAIMPNGGFRMVQGALKTYGYKPDPHVVETFTKYRKTHNEASLMPTPRT